MSVAPAGLRVSVRHFQYLYRLFRRAARVLCRISQPREIDGALALEVRYLLAVRDVPELPYALQQDLKSARKRTWACWRGRQRHSYFGHMHDVIRTTINLCRQAKQELERPPSACGDSAGGDLTLSFDPAHLVLPPHRERWQAFILALRGGMEATRTSDGPNLAGVTVADLAEDLLQEVCKEWETLSYRQRLAPIRDQCVKYIRRLHGSRDEQVRALLQAQQFVDDLWPSLWDHESLLSGIPPGKPCIDPVRIQARLLDGDFDPRDEAQALARVLGEVVSLCDVKIPAASAPHVEAAVARSVNAYRLSQTATAEDLARTAAEIIGNGSAGTATDLAHSTLRDIACGARHGCAVLLFDEPGIATYRGIRIPIKGAPRLVLDAIAKGPNQSRSAADLIQTLWAFDAAGGAGAAREPSTVNKHVSAARIAIRQALGAAWFPCPHDPIPAIDRGPLLAWRLNLP